MTTIDEIAPDVFRLSVYVPEFDMQFNHFLVKDEEPLLFHTGLRSMFPLLREAVGKVLDPATIDWQAVADGKQEVRLRRLPSPANSMGMVKFMMPNDFGIYLHDTPERSHFEKGEYWISNGCIRVEDARRLEKWLYGSIPEGANPKVEEDVPLPNPVPVYVTYFTAAASPQGVTFRPDPYGRDAPVIARYFNGRNIAAVSGGN